jgi:O-methyltransferase
MDGQAPDLNEYFARERAIHRPFGGQLAPEFQAALAQFHGNVTEADCDFYHTMELPDGRVLEGAWDLRGHTDEYLGGVPLADKSVLEYGPASGFLSRAIAESGAALTVFDLALGTGPEVMPFPAAELDKVAASGVISAGRLRNSWWFSKQTFGFSARAVYADIYRQPDDLGAYDVAFFGAILVHLSNPFLAVREAAARTKKTIIITDMLGFPAADQRRGIMQIGTMQPPRGHVHWWNFSAGAFQTMLQRVGFTRQEVTFHSPKSMASQPPMVTVVAHRP